MRSSTNDPYAKSLLENYKRAQAKQIVNRSELTKLVNNGKGTQEQISKVERRRARDRLYDQRKRREKAEEKKLVKSSM